MPRRILIDDTDPGITYTGPWFADRGSQDSLGNFGLPYLHTLHGTTSDASLSYTFQGTVIGITGTQQYDNGTSAVTNPSWECIVDGTSIAVQTYSYANNRLLLCSQFNLPDGTHTVVFKVHVTNNRTFWFDHLTYEPSASVSLQNAAMSLEVPEPDMQFGPEWSKISSGYITSTPGSTFTFDFNGIFLTWYGFYDASLPFAATTGIYTVDGGEPTTFNLNGVAATTTAVQYNQIFFQTPTLPAGLHTLQVTYKGTNSTTPLALEFIIIQNGTSTTSASPGSSATSSASPSPSSLAPTPHSTSHTGPIVGGIIGALAMVTAAILLFLFLRRKERQSQQKVNDDAVREINPRTILPFSLNGNTPSTFDNSLPRNGNPVVGKHNIAAMGTSTAGQLANTPSFSTGSYPLAPVRNVFGKHTHTHSSTSDNVNDGPTSTSSSTSATAIRSDPPSGSDPTSLPSSNGHGEALRSRITRDEDSGIRMRQTDDGDVVVLPPVYTAS